MKEPFELEWMGGPAEHHFRKARPEVNELPWGTINAAKYPPALIEAARGFWTEIAINEYRAAASFTEVLRALIDVKAPLDLIGMASEFLTDECVHVELASRMAMEIGGGAVRQVDMDRFALRPGNCRNAYERANELVLRVSCIAEAFSGSTAVGHFRASSHPLPHAIYTLILADEARHRRLGGLYFEWASDRMDQAENQRLANVATLALKGLSPFWKTAPPPAPDASAKAKAARWTLSDMHELGWLEASKFGVIARECIETDILVSLAEIGIELSDDARQQIFQ